MILAFRSLINRIWYEMKGKRPDEYHIHSSCDTQQGSPERLCAGFRHDCTDAFALLRSAGSDDCGDRHATHHSRVTWPGSLYLGSDGLCAGLNDDDSYRGQALRSIWSQMVPAGWHRALPAGVIVGRSLAEHESVDPL